MLLPLPPPSRLLLQQQLATGVVARSCTGQTDRQTNVHTDRRRDLLATDGESHTHIFRVGMEWKGGRREYTYRSEIRKMRGERERERES
jgi:hypothetical protein